MKNALARHGTGIATLAMGLALLGGNSRATLVISDAFSYGASPITLTTSTATLNGGSGLSGSWALAVTNVNNRAAYVPTGLTFGALLTTGGALRSEGQWAGSSQVIRPVAANQTGTIWGSFLVSPGTQIHADPNADSTGLYIGGAGATGWPADWGISAKSWNSALPAGGCKIGQNTGETVSTGTAMTYDGTQTYLALFKATNLGGAGSKTVSLWYLTADQFGYFKGNGLTEAALNAATLGAASTNVLQRGSVSSSNTALLDATRYLNLNTILNPVGGTVWNMIYDEIRISDNAADGLAEVTPLVPEPASGALLLLLAGGCALRRRHRG